MAVPRREVLYVVEAEEEAAAVFDYSLVAYTVDAYTCPTLELHAVVVDTACFQKQ